MKLSVVQYEVGHADGLDSFVDRLEGLVRACAKAGSELVLLPEYICVELLGELRSRGLTDDSTDPRDALAALPALNDELFPRLAALAADTGVALVAGTYLVPAAGGGTHNTAQVFLPDGGRVSQSKMHVAYELTDNAEDVRPGQDVLVWRLHGFTVAILVCYDAQFPETGRAVLDHAAPDLLLVPGCALNEWGIARMRTGTAARAMESFAFAATAHLVGQLRVGPHRALRFWGRSGVFSPISAPFPVDGVLSDACQGIEQILTVELDRDVLRTAAAEGFPRRVDRHLPVPVRDAGQPPAGPAGPTGRAGPAGSAVPRGPSAEGVR